jgi:hypothetical protein
VNNGFEEEAGFLSKPEVNKIGTKYEVSWGDGVLVSLNRVYTHRDQQVDAEIVIEDFNELGGSRLLGPQRVTLTRGMSGVQRDLKDTSNREDWKQRLLQMSALVLDDLREGEPIIDLNDRSAPETPPERVTGLCYDGTPTLIYGEGGIGKSLWGLTMGMSVHNGKGIGGLFEVIKGNVLILDYETSWEETWRRSRDIIRGSDTDLRLVKYRYCSEPLFNDVDSLRQQIAEENIEFLIIDSAGPACGGEPENANATLQFFQALRALSNTEKPLTSVTLAHVAKSTSGQSVKNPFGSVYWVNMPRNTFELKKAQVQGESYIDTALHHRKTNVGKLREPLAARMSWTGDGLNIRTIPINSRSPLSADLSYVKRANLLYKDEDGKDNSYTETGLTTLEIANLLDLENTQSLGTSLSRSSDFYSENGKWFPSF